jgi:hypothetical protein
MRPAPTAALRLLALAAAFCSTPSGAIQPGSDWALRLPSEEPVVYHGVLNLDAAGGAPGAMLYPAAGVAGLIAAVVTHGVLVESTRNAEKARLQEQADAVLLPFRDQLADFRYPKLLRMAVERVPGPGRANVITGADAATAWTVTSTPVFWLTQDGRALILDNTVSLFGPGESARPTHRVTVRVVSRARAQPDTEWAAPAGNATALQEESAHMVAHSLALALRDTERAATAAGSPKTVRYPEGGSERIERAVPVESLCERRVLRTLRGWLLSVPEPQSDDGTPCAGAAAGWR